MFQASLATTSSRQTPRPTPRRERYLHCIANDSRILERQGKHRVQRLARNGIFITWLTPPRDPERQQISFTLGRKKLMSCTDHHSRLHSLRQTPQRLARNGNASSGMASFTGPMRCHLFDICRAQWSTVGEPNL
jgi:hypothetical protein